MKTNFVTAIIFFGLITCLKAQTPQKMSYQAVVRDASNNLVRDATVGMQISILQGSSSGTAAFVETHTPTTSSAGVVSLEIGAGTAVSGTFTSIDWSNGPYFVQTETDPSGGTSYSITVTSQLLSVPYALYAENSGFTETDPTFSESVAFDINASDTVRWNNKSNFDGDFNSLSNLPDLELALDITADDTTRWGGKSDFDGSYDNLTNKPIIPVSTSDLTNDSGFITSANDADSDPANENQTVSAGVGISVSQTGQDFQVTNTSPDQIVGLTDGGSGNVTIGGTYPDFTIDVTSLDDADASTINELQDLSFNGTSLLISNGSGLDVSTWDTDISDDFDGDYNTLSNLPDLAVALEISASDTARWTNKSDFDGEYNSLNNRPNWSDSLDAHVSNISVPSTFYDSDFKIVNSSGIAGNPTIAPNTFLAGFGAGNVDNGTHDYAVTFVTSAGETGSGPSSGAVNVSNNTNNGQVLLTNIPVSTDGSVTARNIYRRFNGSGTYYYLTTINDNSTASFIDNMANVSLGGSLPGSNSTERSIQFLASGLSGNRVYTLPDASGKLVIDEGSVSLKTVADKSLKNDGRGIIQQFINNGYSKSADEKEWFDAYTDSDGKGDGVELSLTDALFVNDKYVPLSNNFIDPSTLINDAGWTDAASGIDGNASTYATISSTTTNFTYNLGGTFTDQFVYYAALKATYNYNVQFPSAHSLKLQSYNGSNWVDESILLSGTNNKAQTVTQIIAINKSIQGLRLEWSGSGSGDPAGPDEQRLFYINFCTTLTDSQIVHTIPTNTFSSNLGSSYLTTLVSTWEEGASIQYKFQNDTEDSGWLNYNEVSSFTALTSEPTRLIIKLKPKTTNATIGYPSIQGFYITEL